MRLKGLGSFHPVVPLGSTHGSQHGPGSPVIPASWEEKSKAKTLSPSKPHCGFQNLGNSQDPASAAPMGSHLLGPHRGLHVALWSWPGTGVYSLCSCPTEQGGADARPWPHFPAGEPGKCGSARCQGSGKRAMVSALCSHSQEATPLAAASSHSKIIREYLSGSPPKPNEFSYRFPLSALNFAFLFSPRWLLDRKIIS